LTTPIEMQGPELKLSKREIITVNSRNIATMASQIFSMSYVNDAFLLGNMDLKCGRKKKKINNLKWLKI
jgi:hypothetical protein